MKIQFVFGPPLKKPKYDEWYEGHLPPLGILYLAAYLRGEVSGLKLHVTDGLIKGLEGTLGEIKTFQPDILCVSIFTAVALGSYELINQAKNVFPHMAVIVGGPHPTPLPEDALLRSATDVVVRGEGEVTLTELVKLYIEYGAFHPSKLQAVDGIAYRVMDDQVAFTRPRAYIADLDTIPFPARDLLPMTDYRGYYFHRRTPEYPILMTRGCPFACDFCSEAVWRQGVHSFRWRSAKNIVDEMEDLHYNYGINEIQDVSDEFNGHLRTSHAVCNEMIQRSLDVTWKTLMRAQPFPESLAQAMAQSGCWQVSIGIESGNPEAIKGINKRYTFEKLERTLELLKKYNIRAQGLFILFNVWEDNGELCYESVEMSRNTLRYAEKLVKEGLLAYTGNFASATPYPGCDVYDIALRHNLIKPELIGQWDAWLVEDPIVMKLPGIEELDQLRLMRQGAISITRCLWKQGDLGLRDFPDLARRAIRVLRSEVHGYTRSWRTPDLPKLGDQTVLSQHH